MVGTQTALHRRGPISAGTLWFTGTCLVLSLCLVVVNGIGTGVGATGTRPARSYTTIASPVAANASTSGHVSSYLSRMVDFQPRSEPAPPTPAVSVPSPATAPPPISEPSTGAGAVPTPVSEVSSPPSAPVPTPPTPAALPGRGTATAYGCAAALTYLAAYSAPGFTFECPGSALGHEAMTCIDQPGVCDNEHLIAIADACPAAYMNEASNSWVLTGSSDAPIDPYGGCP
jgi:hypothetical protein